MILQLGYPRIWRGLVKKNIEKAIKECVNVALRSDDPLIPHGEHLRINPEKMLGLKDRSEIKEGLFADIIAVDANPLDNIKTLETLKFVMKGGIVYKQEK